MAVVESPRKVDCYGRGRSYASTSPAKVAKKQRLAKPLPELLTTAPIVVAVGNLLTKFYIHEVFLCDSSDFFKNAQKPEWKGRGERVVSLPDSDVDAFSIYADWLYTGHVSIVKEEKAKATPSQTITNEIEWSKWSKCYELSQFLQDTELSDALIDYAIEKMAYDEEYIEHLPNIIYTITTKTSPHRTLVVDLATKVWLPTSFAKMPHANFPVGFLADMGTACSSTLRTGGVKQVAVHDLFKDKDTCAYHEHTSRKTPCYKIK